MPDSTTIAAALIGLGAAFSLIRILHLKFQIEVADRALTVLADKVAEGFKLAIHYKHELEAAKKMSLIEVPKEGLPFEAVDKNGEVWRRNLAMNTWTRIAEDSDYTTLRWETLAASRGPLEVVATIFSDKDANGDVREWCVRSNGKGPTIIFSTDIFKTTLAKFSQPELGDGE